MNSRLNGSKVSNKFRVIDTIWRVRYHSRNFRSRLFKIIISFNLIGFSIHDFFFIKYFRLRDNHYKNDIIPTLKQWCNIDTALSPHIQIRLRSFDNLFVNVIKDMLEIDDKSMARCHLESYTYSDVRSFEKLVKSIVQYNNMVQVFINTLMEKVEWHLKLKLPHLQKHNALCPKENKYYFPNIIYCFWLACLDSLHERVETRTEIVQYGDRHHLRISTTQELMASSENKNDIIALQTFLVDMTPDIIDWFRRLIIYRNEAIEDYNMFRQNIEHILDDHWWNKSLKGTCGWERGFWRLR
jgi:hypothetical protein